MEQASLKDTEGDEGGGSLENGASTLEGKKQNGLLQSCIQKTLGSTHRHHYYPAKLQDTKPIYKNELHFYSSDEQSEKAIKKTISFTTASENKILRTELNGGEKDWYTEYYKTLLKGT